ncbi:MAG TPA: response regulator, partial [Candidatus Omnitrophota bacterium]|nr:response regulator [Candidatus Omnitrophota bacterium]
DDEKEITMSLTGFFTALGYDMLTALNGSDALKVIDSGKNIDLILLDVMMPGVDGIEVLRHLRKNGRCAKVIIITAYDKKVMNEVEALGVDGFFAKPVDFSKMVDRIKYVLTNREQDTRVYPSKVEPEKVCSKIPKAKLLFFEPNPMVYGFTCGCFAGKGLVTGEYEIRVEYMNTAGLDPLYDFWPDIVIIYDNLFSFNDTKEFAGLIMQSSHKPKAVILHGMFPKMDYELAWLEKEGIKYCNQNTMNDESFRLGNKKLADFVAKTCIGYDLVK